MNLLVEGLLVIQEKNLLRVANTLNLEVTTLTARFNTGIPAYYPRDLCVPKSLDKRNIRNEKFVMGFEV